MKRLVALAASAMLAAGAASAGEAPKLVIDGQMIVTEAKAPAGSPFDTVYSGWTFRSSETQALQLDDFDNPGFIFVELAEELWDTADGSSGKSCADCHGDVTESMKGLRASMPKWNPEASEPWTLEDWINWSRAEHQGVEEPWKWDSQEMLAMTALIGLQSRGMPVTVQTDGPMKPWYDKGKELYYSRMGQLDLACKHCHEDNYGNMIRADHLSQGQINGFPVYRLKWQGLGSIHRRFKGCMKQVRAKPFKPGSDEFTALEIYVASRGAGLAVETPSVRN